MAANKEISIGIKLVTDLKDYQKGFTAAGKNLNEFGNNAEATIAPLRALDNELYSLVGKQKKALSTSEWQKLQTEIDATKKKISEFKNGPERALAPVEQLKKKLTDLNKAQQLATSPADWKKLQTEIDATGEELNDFTGKTKSSFGDMFSKIGGGWGDILKGGLVAGAAMFGAEKIMQGIKAVGDYAVGISKTKDQVEKLAGVHGAAADRMTGEATALAETYSVEVTDAVKATNVMMKTFGGSSKEAFDLMNVGLSGAANSNGDLIEQINEFSPHFQEAGLSASGMFAIIAEGNKQGVFDNKSADMIKEASIRMREMTKSTAAAIDGLGLSSVEIQKKVAEGSMTSFEAMKLVSAKLKEFPQQAPQVGAALADVFGGPGEDGVKFVRMLADVDTSLTGLTTGATAAQQAQINYTNELAEFHTVGAQAFGGVGGMVTGLKARFMSFANDAIKGAVSIINYFIDLYNESMILRGSIQYIGLLFKTVFGFVALELKNIVNVFSGFGKVIKAVLTGNLKDIPSIIKGTFEKGAKNGEEFGKKTAENFSKGLANTLTPKKKVGLIELSTTAAGEIGEKAGTAAGKEFAKATATQMANAFKGSENQTLKVDGFVKLQPISQGELEAVSKQFSTKTDLKLNTGLVAIPSKPQIDQNKLLIESYMQVNAALLNASTAAEALGNSFDEAGMRKELLAEQIQGLIDQGLTPESAAITKLRSEYIALGTGTATAGQLIGTLGGNIAQSAGQGADSFTEFGSNIKNVAKDTIGAFISQGVAALVMGALKSAGTLGPMGLALAPAMAAAAGGLAKTAFSSMIPSFADGGIVYGETIARVAEYSGARNNPEVISPLSKLKGMMQGNNSGTQQVQVEVIGAISNDAIRLSNNKASKRINRRS